MGYEEGKMSEKKVKEICDLLKFRLREFKTGGCKILSRGDNCDCSLCLVDKLHSHIKELELKINVLIKDKDVALNLFKQSQEKVIELEATNKELEEGTRWMRI